MSNKKIHLIFTVIFYIINEVINSLAQMKHSFSTVKVIHKVHLCLCKFFAIPCC